MRAAAALQPIEDTVKRLLQVRTAIPCEVQMLEFLGFGLLRPFQRDGRADFVAAGGEALIRSAVGQILGTVGASEITPGEVPWRTDFGSLLFRLRHQKNDAVVQELARVYVVEALKRWEPRIIVTDVTVGRVRRDGEDVLAIRLRYDVISTNTQRNNVILPNVSLTITV
jgi:phage baseplate assembly protein W